MKLIFIHGRAQGGYNPKDLKKLWIETLKQGLAYHRLELPADLQVEFPFYGDRLDELVAAAKKAKPKSAQATRSNEVAIEDQEELAFVQDYLTEIVAQADLSRAEQHELMLDLKKTRGFFNWQVVQKILEALDKKGIGGNWVIKNVTRDVFAYLTIPAIKTEINQIVKEKFDQTPCVVVGHSLGSIVSYLILKENPQYPVKKLITVGSPLGVKSVQKFLGHPLVMPSCIQSKEWFNAYDERDFVALFPLDKEYFNVQPPIMNKRDINNQTDNRHGIDGYLNDPIIAKTIYDALISIG
ncbi:hypothetical protein [Haliscomenobacter sp.]|uniref:hypothetical protein n=1 Tax=Haliscomenobacter sp. TaxID=2717303 RepID=UPI0035939C9E